MLARLKLPIVVVLLLSGGALVALGVAHFAGAQDRGEGGDGGPLGTSNRTQLSLCVDGTPALSVSDTEVTKVRESLQRVLASVTDLPTEYRQPVVSQGCPPPVGLTGKALGVLDRSNALAIPGRLVGSDNGASAHRLHVYFISPEDYAASFGGDPYAMTTEERFCRGHVCSPATLGLYLRPEISSEVLRRALMAALALTPLVPEPTEYYQICRAGTPEQWCYGRYIPP